MCDESAEHPVHVAVRRGAGRLRHVHVRATAPHDKGNVRVQLYSGAPKGDAPCEPLGNALSLRRAYAADFLALVREGAAATGIVVTVDGSYYAHALPG